MTHGMTHPRPFRFGVLCERMPTAAALVDQARRAEDLGYATFLLRDHFIREPFGDQLAPFPALVAAAAATTTLRVGTLVLDNDYRHPVLLAKEAATLDALSGGRFELGLGAGWLREEYERAGLRFDPPGVRIGRIVESVRILKGLFAGEPLTYAGQHYSISGLESFPTPVQRPHPPLLLGGGGRRMLRLAAREADIIGVLTSSVASGTLSNDPTERLAARVAEQVDWIRAAAGERFGAIELSLVVSPILTDHTDASRQDAAEDYAHARGWSGLPAAQILEMPALLLGTPARIAEDLAARRARYGFSYLVVADEHAEAFAPVVAQLAGR